jgi:hypothetical protein
MQSFAAVIDAFPSAEALGDAIGVPGGTVRQWRLRDSIPPEYWPRVVEAATAAKIDGLTVEKLAACVTPRKRTRQSAA